MLPEIASMLGEVHIAIPEDQVSKPRNSDSFPLVQCETCDNASSVRQITQRPHQIAFRIAGDLNRFSAIPNIFQPIQEAICQDRHINPTIQLARQQFAFD